MPTGVAGSTLIAELNRLANGGTYPALTAYLDVAGAASKWAGLTVPEDILGALNHKASPARQPKDFKGLGAVCNELAGTTNLSPVDALRSINLP